MKSKILAIPGFLGLPADWDFLQWNNLIPIDWQTFSWNNLPEWASHFNNWVSRHHTKSKILMGYSFGGRLALHALIDQPSLWEGAIIISAHVGLECEQMKKSRFEKDKQWAKRFEQEEWSSLLHAWNQQEIFMQDHFHFNRQEHQYERSQLSHALIHGSLAKQAYLKIHLETLPFPILWVTGSYDQRYCEIAESLTFLHPLSEWINIPNAGHRTPWAQPTIFSQYALKFVNKINFI